MKWEEIVTAEDQSSWNMNVQSEQIYRSANSNTSSWNNMNEQIHRSANSNSSWNMNEQIHRSANSNTDVNASTSRPYSIEIETQKSNENVEDVNRFLNDYEVRQRLMNIRDNVDIREASQLYNKSKTKRRSKFEPRVILLRKKGDKNMVPKEGTPE